jgi:hypothetical protein
MCEYCGCQDVPAIATLTAEHDEIRAVAREATTAARNDDRAAAAQAAGQLLALLGPHVEIEERGLFPAMATEFADHVASLESEHRDLEQVLARIADPTSQASGWAMDLMSAMGDLFGHILREQDGLFPASLSVLTPAQWDQLDNVRAEVTGRAAPEMTTSLPGSDLARPVVTVDLNGLDHLS